MRVTRRGEEGGGSAVDTCQYDVRSQPCKIADMTCDFTADPRPNHSELMTTSIFSANSNTNYRSCSSATTSSLLNMDTSTPLVCPPLPALNLNVELTGVSRECTAGLTNGSSGSRDRGGSGSSSNRGLLYTVTQKGNAIQFWKVAVAGFLFLGTDSIFCLGVKTKLITEM